MKVNGKLSEIIIIIVIIIVIIIIIIMIITITMTTIQARERERKKLYIYWKIIQKLYRIIKEITDTKKQTDTQTGEQTDRHRQINRLVRETDQVVICTDKRHRHTHVGTHAEVNMQFKYIQL